MNLEKKDWLKIRTEDMSKQFLADWNHGTVSFCSKSPQLDWLKQGIWWAWQEGTCKRTPTYEGPFPKACKFKRVNLQFTSPYISKFNFNPHCCYASDSSSRCELGLTKALVLGVTDGESLVALTPVAPHCVHTTAVLAEPRFGLTFILVCVFEILWQKSSPSRTNAGKRAWYGILMLCILPG